jgi:hypothetical protein
MGITPEDERRRALCIDLLERMLEEAKDGRGFETAFFIGTYSYDGTVRNAWTEGQSTLDAVGRLEHLKHELLADMHEDQREER